MHLFDINNLLRKIENRETGNKKLPRMVNLPVGLTVAQKRIYKLLKLNAESRLILHTKTNGKLCFRLMDCNNSPLENFRLPIIKRMIKKEFLITTDFKIINLNQ